MFTSVRSPRVYEHIVRQIEAAIFDGRLRCGDKLPPERELVRQFGASRVAVREALRTLELRGLVHVRHGSAGGHFVREGDADSVRRDLATLLRLRHVSPRHVLEARLAIEPEVARLAALRASDVDVTSLRAVLGVRAEHPVAGARARELDLELHRLVAAAARNPVHAVLVGALMDLEAGVVAREERDPTLDDALDAAHHAIVDAIADGRADDARDAMAAHLLDVQRRLGRRETAVPA
jgi:GntR family transcriptional repressor for pyruvate dehydrogenase complex